MNAHTGDMPFRELADSLARAGLRWSPAKGDRFAIPARDLGGVVFVASHWGGPAVAGPAGGRLLAFNGTTEWALDSLEAAEAVWLPREDQLRTLLGEAFVSLERLPGEPEGWAVTITVQGGDDTGHTGHTERHVDADAESAYARALLAVLSGRPPHDRF